MDRSDKIKILNSLAAGKMGLQSFWGHFGDKDLKITISKGGNNTFSINRQPATGDEFAREYRRQIALGGAIPWAVNWVFKTKSEKDGNES